MLCKTRIGVAFGCAVLAIALSAPAFAQGNTRPGAGQPRRGAPGAGGPRGPRTPMTADAVVKRLTEQLSLTADQQKKAKPLVEDMIKKTREARESITGAGTPPAGAERPRLSQADREKMRTKMTAIRDDFTKKMKALLKPDQQKKLDEIGVSRTRRGGQGRPGGAGARPGAPAAPKKP